jgi:hypothetical protein
LQKITLAEFSNFADLKIFAELFTQTLNFENTGKPKTELLIEKNHNLQQRA